MYVIYDLCLSILQIHIVNFILFTTGNFRQMCAILTLSFQESQGLESLLFIRHLSVWPLPRFLAIFAYCLIDASFAEPLRDVHACFSFTWMDACSTHSCLHRTWRLTSFNQSLIPQWVQAQCHLIQSPIAGCLASAICWLWAKTTINNHVGISFLYELGKYLGMQLLHTVKLFLALWEVVFQSNCAI